jgi:thioredoxin reductase (NADPH)
MERAKMVVIGSGPAGIATAVEAKEAKIASVVILERKGHACDTVVSLYHEGKRVDPVYRKLKLEPTGKLSFDTEPREAFLKRVSGIIEKWDLDIRYRSEAQKIVQSGGKFHIFGSAGMELETPIVVVAIGKFGKPIRPSYPIPGEIKDRVYFSIPKTPVTGKRVLVIGGGDSAAETACFLSGGNQVTLSYRRAEFFRLNEINACNVDDCACKGAVTLMMGTDIEGLEASGDAVRVHFKDCKDLDYDAVFYCLGGMTPRVFLEGIGVEFDDNRPVVDEYGETNIARLFLAGDLLVKKGSIMAAFNSGKQIVDGILSRYGELVRD